jgi:hypothetical protein
MNGMKPMISAKLSTLIEKVRPEQESAISRILRMAYRKHCRDTATRKAVRRLLR